MSPRYALLGATGLAALAHAAQPGAVAPIPAPMRNLTWGQLNFLHTTDTHGWLAGHLREPQYSADWGDYVSFASHMHHRANAAGVDLILVDTGDRVEGNGLYDASHPPGLFLSDIYREAPVDIICTGNHELYRAPTARREHEIVAGRNFADRYLASNLDYIEPDTGKRVPQSKRRFRRFKTPNQGLEILSFGFVFNFQMNANNTVVQAVQDTVKEAWFEDEIKKKADVIVVTGHVGLRMQEFKTIYAAIRKLDWFTPVVFLGGHAHVRDAASFDSKSFAIASGRFFETVGWMSVDGIKKNEKAPGQESLETGAGAVAAESSPSFARRYIDNNLLGYYYHSGLDEATFATTHGQHVSNMISRARTALDLDHTFGCVPKTMWMNRAQYPSEDNLYTWVADRVLPEMLINKKRLHKPRIAILNTGGIRFDILEGPFTRDSAFSVIPFQGKFKFIPGVPYAVAGKVLDLLNSQEKIFSTNNAPNCDLGLSQNRHPIPPAVVMPPSDGLALAPPQDQQGLRLELRSADAQTEQPNSGAEKKPDLTYGYTTHDDIGDDGDDTVHATVDFYPVPNCVQAEVAFPSEGGPETVDLVFIDFVQPWIIPALKLAGGDFSDDHVEPYADETLTYMLSQWIAQNWKC